MLVHGANIRHYPTEVPAQPLVSIIVLAYNQETYIAQCLESILQQETSHSYEIIIGEDNSTDGTLQICQNYAEKHPDKIRLIGHHPQNKIHLDGKPTGIFNMLYNYQEANGKYIALCEGDDYWSSTSKLQQQVDFLENNPDYSICFHPVQLLDKQGVKHPDHLTQPPKGTSTVHDLVKGNYIRTPSIVYRKHYESYPEYIQTCTPGDFIIYLLNALQGNIMCLPETMAVYRTEIGSWSSLDALERSHNSLIVYRNLHQHLKDTAIGNDLENIIHAKAIELAGLASDQQQYGLVREVLQTAASTGDDALQKLILDRIKAQKDPAHLADHVGYGTLLKALLKKVKKRMGGK